MLVAKTVLELVSVNVYGDRLIKMMVLVIKISLVSHLSMNIQMYCMEYHQKAESVKIYVFISITQAS